MRAPASAIREEVPVREGRAEPQLELWIESGRHVTPTEAARATAEARAALEAAVAGRQVPDGDALLVVRAQGVTRTSSRRSDQRAAVAGMVVGAVVVVAAVVVMVVTSRGGGGGGGAPRGTARAASPGRSSARGTVGAASATGAATRVAGGRPRASPGRMPVGPVRASPRPVRPGPWLGPAPHHHAGPFVSVELWYALHLAPAWSEPLPAEWEPLPPPGPGADAPPWAAEATEAAPGEASPVDTLVLAPPPELRVADRGFFARDETVLELTWVDRQSGGPLRVKTVRAGVDPRDARKVRKLLDDALADERGWAPAFGVD